MTNSTIIFKNVKIYKEINFLENNLKNINLGLHTILSPVTGYFTVGFKWDRGESDEARIIYEEFLAIVHSAIRSSVV